MINDKYYDTLNSIDTCFILVNNDLSIDFINDSARKYLKIRKKTVEGIYISRLVDADFMQLIYEEIENVIKTQTKISFEKLEVRNNKWIKFNMLPSKGGASIFFTDISKKKEKRAFLDNANDLNTAILNSIKSNIAIINSKGVILQTNNFWNEFALNNNVSKLDKIGVGANYIELTEKAIKKSRDAYAVKAVKGIYNVINNVINDFYLEYPCDSLDEQRWFMMKVTRVLNEDDKFLISHSDISSLKKSELDLIKSKHSLMEAQRIAKVCNWEFCYKTNTYSVSDQFYDLFELDKQTFEVTMNNFINLIDENYVDYFNSKRQIANEKFRNTTIQYKTKPLNGNIKYIYNTIEFELDKQGKPIKRIGILKDVTEQKFIEKKLISQNNELKKVNNELDLFVYNTSHDLRAPLKSILGLSSIIKEELDKGDFEQLKRLEMIEGTVTKLDNFIEDILHYARNARLDNQFHPINFDELIENIRSNHKYMANAESITLHKFINNTYPCNSDVNRLTVILNNLITNSVKYQNFDNPTNSFVNVTISNTAFHTTIVVEDNGMGIESSKIASIFDMFKRGTNKSTGTGLGLYLVKEMVSKLEGTLNVKSTINVGTTFNITIPNNNCNNN